MTASGGIVDGFRTVKVEAAKLEAGVSILELFQLAGLASSNAEVRRLIRGGGARLNDDRIDDEHLVVDQTALAQDTLKLSAGKKRHVLVRAA
jgi:tyrosyl-tRNA synthetase